jgi:hypothetical protein
MCWYVGEVVPTRWKGTTAQARENGYEQTTLIRCACSLGNDLVHVTSANVGSFAFGETAALDPAMYCTPCLIFLNPAIFVLSDVYSESTLILGSFFSWGVNVNGWPYGMSPENTAHSVFGTRKPSLV